MGTTSLEGDAMKWFIADIVVLALWLAVGTQAVAAESGEPPATGKTSPKDSKLLTTLVVVVGAAGDESYQKIFTEEAELWRKVASTSQVKLRLLGESTTKDDATDKAQLKTILAEELQTTSPSALWLIFIGHGTFDGRTAAFNLRGPDLSSAELVEWVKDGSRPLAFVNTTAASAPFLTALSGPNRVIVTATKSGQERNYARFGRYFARRVIDDQADLDKDEQTSLFEAFLAASRDTAAFYASEGRIATEHPLLDDNGDGRGVRPDFFERGKPVKMPAGQLAIDGDLARRFQLKPSNLERSLTPARLARRDELETLLTALRRRKSELNEDEYYENLERLLVELSQVYMED